MITMIACVDKNMGIGKDNELLTHLPKDLAYFKETTKGEIVVFGKNTWESLPVRPLPDRVNVVLTRGDIASYEGCIVADIELVIALSELYHVFICGGESIYKQFMSHADEMVISHMKADFEADTFFPDIDEGIWNPYYKKTVEDKVTFEIIKYKNKQNH